jgi:hypothetical protein
VEAGAARATPPHVFEHGFFGFVADRANESNRGKCRRIEPDFEYPQLTNSLAQREQIEI